MLKLFADIFGHAQEAHPGKLPPALVDTVIERAVDGTDPRLRIVGGYKKALKNSVVHAADYIVGIVDGLPAPVAAGKAAFATNPCFAAMLYSEEVMEDLVSRDAAMKEFRALHGPNEATVTALLIAQRVEKHGFGYGKLGDQTVADVPQTTVSFEQRRFLEPSFDEKETRRLLQRRAFDHLLSVALEHIADCREERESLKVRRALLRSKLDIMQRSGGFTQHAASAEQAKLQADLDRIEQELAALGPSEDVLASNLDTVVDVLSTAENHLWLEETTLCLDQFYVLHDRPGPSAPAIVFNDLRDSAGRQASLLLLNVPVAPKTADQ
ncbi:MAG: hypothetical protein V2I66_09360 [Halieaceae bacterium]|jgi:hypothetical protein|nr:hypothetical protein [Halieaceae bacterium]